MFGPVWRSETGDERGLQLSVTSLSHRPYADPPVLNLAMSSQRHKTWLVTIISDLEMIQPENLGRGGDGSSGSQKCSLNGLLRYANVSE